MKKNLPKEIEKECKKIAQQYAKRIGNNLMALALFGSYARGDFDEESDLDLLLVAKRLPRNILKRQEFVSGPLLEIAKRKFAVMARTKKEFSEGFPSIYLDLGMDAVILYDPQVFLTKKLERVRELIKEAGLRRVKLEEGEYAWHWKNPPRRGWGIDWKRGFYEF